MSGKAHKPAAPRAKPYDRPATPRKKESGGLRSFISGLFWGRQALPEPEQHLRIEGGHEDERDEDDLAEAGEGGMSVDETTHETEEVAPPPPPRRRADSTLPPPRRPLPTSTSTPNLSRFPGQYGTPGLGSPGLFSPARSTARPTAPASQRRGETLLRDVDQMSIPTVFTPHFEREAKRPTPASRAPRPMSGIFSSLSTSRSVPSLSAAAERPDVTPASVGRSSSRKQLYLGPGYSAQNIARRRREQNMLSTSQSAVPRFDSTMEPIAKRRKLADAPQELPAVKAAIAQHPQFPFTFSSPLPARIAEPPVQSTPGRINSAPAPPSSLQPESSVSPPKPKTRSANLIRSIFDQDKSESQNAAAADLSNPYQRMDSPIARVPSIKGRKSIRVPREQVVRPAAPMTPMERLEATAPPVSTTLNQMDQDLSQQEIRKAIGKRARVEEQDEPAAASVSVSKAPAPASSLPAPKPIEKPKPAPAVPAPAFAPRSVAAPAALPSLAPPSRSQTASAQTSRSSTPARSSRGPPPDVEPIDLDASSDDDDEPAPPPPKLEGASKSAPAPTAKPVVRPAPPVKQTQAAKASLSSNPFAALAGEAEEQEDDDEDDETEEEDELEEEVKSVTKEGSKPSASTAPANPFASFGSQKTVEPAERSAKAAEKPAFSFTAPPKQPIVAKNPDSPMVPVSTEKKSAAAPVAFAPLPAQPSKAASQKHATPEDQVGGMAEASLPSFELLVANFLPPRVADPAKEGAALAVAEKDLPVFGLLS